MIAVSPFPEIGWTAAHSATADPRIPTTCPWCLGSRVLAELDILGAFGASLVLVVCGRCSGTGTVRVERRSGR